MMWHHERTICKHDIDMANDVADDVGTLPWTPLDEVVQFRLSRNRIRAQVSSSDTEGWSAFYRDEDGYQATLLALPDSHAPTSGRSRD